MRIRIRIRVSNKFRSRMLGEILATLTDAAMRIRASRCGPPPTPTYFVVTYSRIVATAKPVPPLGVAGRDELTEAGPAMST